MIGMIFLIMMTIVCGGVGVYWLLTYRHGQPFNIDESGYLCIALNDYRALTHGGIIGLIKTFEWPSIQAPLMTSLTAILFYLFGVNLLLALLVPLAFYIGTIWAAYFLTRSFASLYAGVLSTVLVAFCPPIIAYSRDYIFASPAMFFYTFTLLALVRSRHFTSWGWGLAFGVACGLIPLARTVTISFIPGIWLAAGLYAISGGTARQSLKILVVSLVVSVLVALLWLGKSGKAVFEYLTNYGYGAHASEYGQAFHISLFGFIGRALNIINYSANTLYFALVLYALVSFAIFAFIYGPGRLRAFFRSVQFPLLICVLEPLAALCSTQNIGTGFFLPVLPVLISLCCAFIFDNAPSRLYQYRATAVMLLIASFGFIPALDESSILARPLAISAGPFGKMVIVDGLGITEQWEKSVGYGRSNKMPPVNLVAGQAWMRLNAETAWQIQKLGGINPTAAFGFDHLLYNTGSVSLQEYLQFGGLIGNGIYGVDPVITGNSVEGDTAWLNTGQARDACVLLTAEDSNSAVKPFIPFVNQANMVRAAMQANFRKMKSMPMPDGNVVIFWVRKAPSPCASTQDR